MISRLREIGEVDTCLEYYGKDGDADLVTEIETLLFWCKEVDHYFEKGGRWSNFEVTTYEINEDGETAYFQVTEERPATEMQECGEFTWVFFEVEPYQETITKYRGV